MRRLIILVVVIFFILCTIVSLWAQNIVIQVYDPQSLLLKQSGLFQMQMPFTCFEKNPALPIQKELALYQLIDNDELFAGYRKLAETFPAKENQQLSGQKSGPVVSRILFKTCYNKPLIDEKTMLRQDWQEAFGFDVWYPYYKFKEVEGAVKKSLSVKIFKMKGAPQVEKGKILYVFSTTF
jgi:hypothetical protein